MTIATANVLLTLVLASIGIVSSLGRPKPFLAIASRRPSVIATALQSRREEDGSAPGAEASSMGTFQYKCSRAQQCKVPES